MSTSSPEPKPYSRIAILGAGAWGTALALTARAAGRETQLWVRETEVLESIRETRRNPFLPGVEMPADLRVTGDLKETAKAEALLVVVPAQVLHAFADRLRPHLRPGQPVVICAKGIEQGTGRLVTEVAAEALPETPLAILTGLHARWTTLLRTLDAAAFDRPLLHPERGPMTLGTLVQLYAWHGRHHAGHLGLIR